MEAAADPLKFGAWVLTQEWPLIIGQYGKLSIIRQQNIDESYSDSISDGVGKRYRR